MEASALVFQLRECLLLNLLLGRPVRTALSLGPIGVDHLCFVWDVELHAAELKLSGRSVLSSGVARHLCPFDGLL